MSKNFKINSAPSCRVLDPAGRINISIHARGKTTWYSGRCGINQSGFVLVAITTVVAVLILLAFYFLDFVITDSKIAVSQNLSTQTYYLAEAGIQEAIWKIKNDPDWQNSFQTNPSWTASLIRNNIFGQENSYQVSVTNLDLAEAEIVSTGSINLGSATAKRVVKTVVFQALNPSALPNASIFSDRDNYFSGVNLRIINGGLFANDDIRLALFSDVEIENDASAVGQINISWSSNMTANAFHASNYPPPATSVEMPQVDFDSADPNSYKSRADHIYTYQQFRQLLIDSPSLTISGITYVTGNVQIERGQTLNVSGVLVADGQIFIGTNAMPFWQTGPRLYVSSPPGQPSGLLAKGKIKFGSFVDDVGISGLLYANDSIRVNADFMDFDLVGGFIARDIEIYSLWNDVTLTYDPTKIDLTLGNPTDAPIINIDHWEEEY